MTSYKRNNIKNKIDWTLHCHKGKIKMCDYCSKLFRSDTRHEQAECPVAAAMYCSVCQIRGHATMSCPDKAAWETRKPEYIEQLIPSALRMHHGIPSSQMTPIQNANGSPFPCEGNRYSSVIEIPEDKDGTVYTGNVRSTLASYNLPVSSGKDNRKLLIAFGSLIGKEIVFTKKDRFVLDSLAAQQGKKVVYKQNAEEVISAPKTSKCICGCCESNEETSKEVTKEKRKQIKAAKKVQAEPGQEAQPEPETKPEASLQAQAKPKKQIKLKKSPIIPS